MRYKMVYAVLAALPVVVFAFSTGPPIRRTGAAVDGGITCAACHNTFGPANSDPRGSVSIDAGSSYTPGVAQTIRVMVKHPEAVRWGFQLTARLASDPTKETGVMAADTVVRVRCDPTGDAPCNGALEFAEHSNAPRTDPGAGFTFSIQWTPPSTDVGDIVFYAAGNAANGNGGSSGDRIYTAQRTVSTCKYTAKPTISALTDAASFRAAWAPNEILTIFGAGFYPAGRTRVPAFGEFENGSYPRDFACLGVEIAGERVPITYVDAGQLNVQAPTSKLNGGPVNLTVVLNPGRTGELRSDVTVNTGLQRFAPAFFTFNGKSVFAQAGTDTIADPAVVKGARFAKPGEVVSMYATGLGYTNPVWQAGEIPTSPAALSAPYSVTMGGTTLAAADVLYAGLSVGSISCLYQVNVRIPANAPDGDLSVTLTVNGVSTQAGATIPIKK